MDEEIYYGKKNIYIDEKLHNRLKRYAADQTGKAGVLVSMGELVEYALITTYFEEDDLR